MLRDLPTDRRIGVGSVNQKLDRVESVEEILQRAEAAVQLFGAERILLTPDCGFATFADNPIASADVAERKLTALVEAKRRLVGTPSARGIGRTAHRQLTSWLAITPPSRLPSKDGPRQEPSSQGNPQIPAPHLPNIAGPPRLFAGPQAPVVGDLGYPDLIPYRTANIGGWHKGCIPSPRLTNKPAPALPRHVGQSLSPPGRTVAMLWLDELSNEGHILAIYQDDPGDRGILSGKTLRTEDTVPGWPPSRVVFLPCAAWNGSPTIRTTVNRGSTRRRATEPGRRCRPLCVRSWWPGNGVCEDGAHRRKHQSRARDGLLRWISRTATAGNTSNRWARMGHWGVIWA